LVVLTFIPKVQKGVQMGLKSIDESPYHIIAPRLLSELLGELPGPIAIYTDDGSKTESLVRFGVFLFRFPKHCGIFTAEIYDINVACDFIKSKPMGAGSFASIERLKSTGMSYRTNDMLFHARMSLNDVGIQGNEPADVLAK
jgi:hypothetical protein